MEAFKKSVVDFEMEIRKFERALGRFDEIILSKSSKHDMELIKKEL